MKEKNVTVNNKGIGFLGALQVAFIVLKLCEVITWSWWVVLIPLWIELGLVLIALLGIIIGLICQYIIDKNS